MTPEQETGHPQMESIAPPAATFQRGCLNRERASNCLSPDGINLRTTPAYLPYGRSKGFQRSLSCAQPAWNQAWEARDMWDHDSIGDRFIRGLRSERGCPAAHHTDWQFSDLTGRTAKYSVTAVKRT